MRASRRGHSWREHLGGVAAAVGELLVLGTTGQPVPASNPIRALAARDRVVAGLRELLAAAGHAPASGDGPVSCPT